MIDIANRVRELRKEKNMTQQDLADLLNVTVGAVYKWEAGISYPSLDLIVIMADYFEVSTDVLLNYEAKDNKLSKSLERLKDYRIKKDEYGVTYGELLLSKYPNNFDVTYNVAKSFYLLSFEKDDKDLLKKALDIYEKSLILINQNTDDTISPISIAGDIASIKLLLGMPEEAIETYKEHNIKGIYNDEIGQIMSNNLHDYEEAQEYLQRSFLDSSLSIMRVIASYINMYIKKEMYKEVELLVNWSIKSLRTFYIEGRVNVFYKFEGFLYALLAYGNFKMGKIQESKSNLVRSDQLYRTYKENPVNNLDGLKFIKVDGVAIYGNIGNYSSQGVRGAIEDIEDDEFTEFWKEIENELRDERLN